MNEKKEKKKDEKIEIVKKICPLNPDLDCPDCRMYELVDRGIMRCVFFSIRDALDLLKLHTHGE